MENCDADNEFANLMPKSAFKLLAAILYTIRPSAALGATLLTIAAFQPMASEWKNAGILAVCAFSGSAFCFLTNDLYDRDDMGNGDFDYDVAGVGQASDGSNHRDARGSGIVRMWNLSNLSDGEFLFWGHDNTSLTSAQTTDVDGTVIEERLSRVWSVSETGDVGTVSLSFDFSALPSPLGSNLRLLIDRDGDGFMDNDVTPIEGAESNDIVTFSNINFSDGDRFTEVYELRCLCAGL